MVELYPFQRNGLNAVEDLNRVAFYWDMGTGKTFVGSEKMAQLGAKVNLVICQKSKIDDWVKHFQSNYDFDVFDLTDRDALEEFMTFAPVARMTKVGIINYELAFRRPELRKLRDFTLMLDESSMIQNETAKRSKFVLGLRPANVILLSGTPTGGKYEKLYSQLKLLGWDISKTLYWRQFINYRIDDSCGFPMKIVTGYKNIDRLKAKLREYGATFLKTEDVIDLPEQVFQTVDVETTADYRKFIRNRIIDVKTIVADDGLTYIKDDKLIGDTTLTTLLYARMLCGQYNPSKIEAFRNLIQSSDDRMIVFYNFNGELDLIRKVCKDEGRPVSVVNGRGRDLTAYETHDNSVTLIQYQAGSMGLNLQKANKVIYFTPPLSSELYEQSKKRTHRIGQGRTCFYYQLTCKGSVEEHIYATLAMRKDFTDKLFEVSE